MQKRYPKVPVEVLTKDFDTVYGALLQVGKGDCPISEVNLETCAESPVGAQHAVPLSAHETDERMRSGHGS